MPTDHQIPAKYLCSITGQVMIDPVIAADGYTYERESIDQWLKIHDTSPRTNIKLVHKNLTDNHDKRGDILEFLDSHPELYEGNEVYLPKDWIAQCSMAIKQNQLQTVQQWLNKDKRLLTLKLEGNFTALHLACEFSSPELVDIVLKTLKQRNQSIQLQTVGFKPVHLNVLLERALNSGDHAQCELLLRLGAEVEQPKASTQNTLLHRMVIKGNIESVSWLLEKKAVLESRNREGNTPLLLAVIHNHAKLVEFLLKRGANSKVKNVEQKSIVLIAVLNQNEPMLRLLVGAEKSAIPALHLALELNDNEMIKILLRQKVIAIEARDERERTPFYSAVERGNLEAVRLFLSKDASPMVSCGTGQLNTLHVATERSDVEMLKYLLQTKAAALIDVQNSKGETPLHLAAHAGRDDIILLLLEAGAYHKIKNGRDQTPIELARVEQKPEIENLIIQAARRIKKSKLKETEKLHQLVSTQASEIEYFKKATLELKNTLESQERGFRAKLSDMQAKITLLQQLIEVGVDFNPTDKHDGIPIRRPGVLAAKKGYATAITALKAFGANLDIPDTDGKTPVYVAAENGHAAVIATLRAAGAAVETSSSTQHNYYHGHAHRDFGQAIHIAAKNGHAAVITALKAAGANVDVPDSNGRTPIRIAVENGHVEAIRALQAAGANVNAIDKDEKTLIHIVVEDRKNFSLDRFSDYNPGLRQAEIIATLKSLGANVDSPDKDGKTPVYIASEKGNAEAIMALKAAGADVEKVRTKKSEQHNNYHYHDSYQRNDFNKPIHIAAKNGHAEAITALKASGADVNALDTDGNMPVHIAVENSHIEAIRALKSAGANVNALNRSGKTLVFIVIENRELWSDLSFHSFGSHSASRKGAQLVATLKGLGANIDIRNQDDKTPLFIAAENGQLEAITALLDAGANASLTSRHGTALEAARRGSSRSSREIGIVRLLETHLQQYPDGVKPVRIEKEAVSLHANFSRPEHKSPSTLTQFQQSTALARKSPVAQLQLKTVLKNKGVG